nr:GFA family protein [uncultured Dongia sp.]
MPTCQGSCLCGQVSYEVDLPFETYVNCHCSRCRKANGSAHAANATVLPAAFRWLRGEVVRFDLPEARSFAVAFCRHCGSQQPHATRSGSRVIVPTGTLDTDPGEHPTKHVFWSSRALWSGALADLPKVD